MSWSNRWSELVELLAVAVLDVADDDAGLRERRRRSRFQSSPG